jgi:hypothetical protein
LRVALMGALRYIYGAETEVVIILPDIPHVVNSHFTVSLPALAVCNLCSRWVKQLVSVGLIRHLERLTRMKAKSRVRQRTTTGSGQHVSFERLVYWIHFQGTNRPQTSPASIYKIIVI